MAQNQDIIDASQAVAAIVDRTGPVDVCGLSGSERAYLIAAVLERWKASILVVVPSIEDAQQLAEELRFFTRRREVPLLVFPGCHVLPLKFLSYHNETAAERLRVLYRLMSDDTPTVVIAPVSALIQRLIPRRELNRYAELIVEGEETDRERLMTKLIAGGYLRTAIVEDPGDFSVRGGIVDVFSPLYPDPLRIEFYGDRVESLRFFNAGDQRRIGSLAEAVILPARESILSPETLPEILQRVRLLAAELNLPTTQLRTITTRLANQEAFPGVDGMLPLVYPELDGFLDYLPAQALCIRVDPERQDTAAAEVREQTRANDSACRDAGKFCVPRINSISHGKRCGNGCSA